MFEETFAQAKRKLEKLMNPEQLHATAVQFLVDGGEWEEAGVLGCCALEYGEIERCCGTVYEVNVTLRCERALWERLKRTRDESGWEEEPPLKLRLVEAIKESLPSGYGVGNVEARAKAAGSRAAEESSGGGLLTFERFSEPDTLAKAGKKVVDELLGPFSAKLAEAGLGLPETGLEDSKYFAAISGILGADRLPPEVRKGVDEMLESARLITAEFRREAEADFAKRHHLFPLWKKESGRRLLSAVAGCYGMRPDYPEKLTPEQSELVGWILDYLRDYIDYCDDVEPGNLVGLEREVSEKLEELEKLGLAVFAGGYTGRMKYENGTSGNWPVTVVLVAPTDDPRIKRDAEGKQYINGAIPKKVKEEGEERAPAANGKREDGKGAGAGGGPAGEVAALKAHSEEIKAEIRKALDEARRQGRAEAEPAMTRSEAQRVFEVLTKLRTETGIRKAPLHTVFEYMVLQGMPAGKTARECGCAASLITARMRTLKERFGMSVAQLQAHASEIREMESVVKGDRRRRKSDGATAAEHEGDGDFIGEEDEMD